MFKRVTADLMFTLEDEAEDFYHDCALALTKAVTINSGLPDQEQSHIIIQECYHAESEGSECVTIEEDYSDVY